MSTWTYSNSNETNLMKQKYGKLIEKQFNMDNVILGRIKKKQDLGGKGIDIPLIQSIGGGVGAGSLPTANENKIGLVRLNDSKKLYATVTIDRETMKRAKKDSDSFVRMTKFPVQIAVKSFNRNLTRQILRNDIAGAGAIATAEASGSHTTTKVYLENHDLAVFEAIEVGDLLDFYDNDACSITGDGVEVSDIVVVDGGNGKSTTGSYIEFASTVGATPAVNDVLYMQGSQNNELDGIKGVLGAAVGTTYKAGGLTIGRRFKSYQKNASSASISTDLLNDLVINIKRQSGESPDMLLTSFHQFVKILNLLEDQKRYSLPARDKKFKGQVSFAGVEFMSADGAIPVIPDRFMDSDKVYGLNTKHIELHQTPGGFEWFDEDGTVFLRESGVDSYSARYGGYCELFINPHFQGELNSLAV